MNSGRVSTRVFLCFLMMIFLMVTVGCSKSDDAPPAPATTYTVTFDSQSATTAAAPTSLTVTLPATTVGALPTAPTRTSYNFAGWYTSTSGDGTQFTASTPVTASITVYAYWTTSTVYTVTYDSQDGTAVGAQYVISGGTVGTLPAAPTKTGYNFGSWNTAANGSGTAFIGTTVVTGHITVYAQWASYSYSVTFDSQSGTPTPTPITVDSPDTTVGALPTAPTRTSYTFAGWYTSTGGGGTQFTASTPVTANITVYAYWTASTVYTVTYDSQSGSAVSPQQVVSGGTVGTLPANPTRTGYTFGGWFTATSGGGTQFTGTTVVTGSITVYAKWTATGTAGTAAGTFTYAAGSLNISWTSSNFPCNGPTVGSEVDPVTITTTTMTLGDMTWTRSPAGAANDPAGTWTSTDNNGNSYTLVVTGTTSGSVSVTANIITCTWLETYHSTGDYGVWTGYNDPAHAVTSVSLEGTGIPSQALTYSASEGDWSSGVDFGASPPAFPYTYNFTITKGTSWVETATISCFVDTLPTVTAPGATVTTATPTFSWNAVANALQYQVKVYDGMSQIWSSDKTTSLSIVYNSSTSLTTGKTYSYQVIVRGNTACPKGQSYTQGNFTTSF